MPGDGRRQGGGLALNQLLVRDGRHRRAAAASSASSRADQHVPRRAVHRPAARSARCRCGCKPPKPRKEEVYFIGACNVPLNELDPALTRPGRMGRHIYFRTPTWEDRRDIFDLYLGKVAHEEELDTERRRDELARITNGYSPAMIDQVCSLALTYAHSDGRERVRADRPRRGDDDGRVRRRDRPALPQARGARDRDPRGRPRRLRATSTWRTGSRPACRSASAAPPAATTRRWRSRTASATGAREEVGELIWGLGAMAAEHVFYGQNTTGVGGDIGSATTQAAHMVGFTRMAPAPIDLSDRIADPSEREEREARRWSASRSSARRSCTARGGGADGRQPVRRRLGDREQEARWWPACSARRSWSPTCTIRRNKDGDRDRSPTRLIERGRDVRRRGRRPARRRRPAQARDRRAGRGDMARDLIPPPSPPAARRRPEADATPPPPPEPTTAPSGAAARPPRTRTASASCSARCSALGARGASSPRWRCSSPRARAAAAKRLVAVEADAATASRGAAQIAAHVGASTTLPTATQLVGVKAGPIEVADLDAQRRRAARPRATRSSPARACSTCLTASARTARSPAASRRERAAAAAPRGARARALHVPLPHDVDQVVALLPPRRPGEDPTAGRSRDVFQTRTTLGPALEPAADPHAASRRRRRPTRCGPRDVAADRRAVAGHHVYCVAYQVGAGPSAPTSCCRPSASPPAAGHSRLAAARVPERSGWSPRRCVAVTGLVCDAQALYRRRAAAAPRCACRVAPWLFRLPWFRRCDGSLDAGTGRVLDGVARPGARARAPHRVGDLLGGLGRCAAAHLVDERELRRSIFCPARLPAAHGTTGSRG